MLFSRRRSTMIFLDWSITSEQLTSGIKSSILCFCHSNLVLVFRCILTENFWKRWILKLKLLSFKTPSSNLTDKGTILRTSQEHRTKNSFYWFVENMKTINNHLSRKQLNFCRVLKVSSLRLWARRPASLVTSRRWKLTYFSSYLVRNIEIVPED